MKLDGLYESQLEGTRYAERYVNNVKAGKHSNWSDSSVEYSPHEGLSEFPLPVYSLSGLAYEVLTAEPDPRLVRDVLGKDVKFFVHPDLSSDLDYMDRTGLINARPIIDEPYFVSPTSSTRTLLTANRDYNFMIKTDLDKRHYRFIRRLKGSSVDHSIRVSQELSRICQVTNLDEFAFLPESLGIIIGDQTSGAGVLFREIIPRPIIPENRVLIPFFSLYADDLKNQADLPLLIQLIQKNCSPGEELDFLVYSIIGLVVRNWTKFAMDFGMLLETHGQNTLIEIDANLSPRRMVFRDFQGMYFDRKIREESGLDMPVVKHIVGDEVGTDRQSQFSLNYDHFVGDYLFERLTDTFLRHYPQYDYEMVTSKVRDIFRSAIPDPSEILPDETYTFGPQIENEVNLIVKSPVPIWR